MTQIERDISTNTLRAWAGAILLIMALASMVLKQSNDTINYIMFALAGFLVGGAVLGQIINKHP